LNNNKDQTGDATASLVAYEPPAERNGEILLSVTVKPVDNPITIIKAVSKLADKVNSVVEVYNEQMKAGVKFPGRNNSDLRLEDEYVCVRGLSRSIKG
jgi:hypothetical protein